MDRRLSSVKTSLARAVHLVFRNAGRAFPRNGWRPLREVQRFSQQVRGASDSPRIAELLVSAISQGMAAERVLLFLLHPDQEELVVAAAEGVDEPYPVSLRAGSPFLGWLGEQHRAVAFEEVHHLPQWHGLPPAEREALSALGCRLLVSMGIRIPNTALLVLGSRKGGAAYTRQEIEGLELLAHQATAALEIAHLHHQLDQGRQELRQARAQLADSTRMAAAGEAASALAKEIEASLQTIARVADAMGHGVEEKGPSRQALDAVKAETAHAYAALLPILDLAHEDGLAWRDHDLNSLLSSAVSDMGLNTTSGKVELTLQLDPGARHVWCDGERMKHVFINPIANALDAMPQGGLLTISTRVVGEEVEVKFTDTGIGVPPEHIERIFDIFFTTKPGGRGTGVGLAASRRTVERHQGTITVDSKVGKGTTVIVLLPVEPTNEVTHHSQT